MESRPSRTAGGRIRVHPVDHDNWQAVAQLNVTEAQSAFVAAPTYYLALCCYRNLWRPLAIYRDEQVIGFLMWAIDPDDGSCWLGGILIDHRYQGRGYGREAVKAAMARLATQYGHQQFALSYQPANVVARQLYQSLGFSETDEWDGDEIVARLSIAR